MACWSNEVQASVYPGVMVVVQDPSYLQFFLQVCFKLSIDEFNNGLIALMKGKKKRLIHLTVEEVLHCLLSRNKLFVTFHFPRPIVSISLPPHQ